MNSKIGIHGAKNICLSGLFKALPLLCLTTIRIGFISLVLVVFISLAVIPAYRRFSMQIRCILVFAAFIRTLRHCQFAPPFSSINPSLSVKQLVYVGNILNWLCERFLLILHLLIGAEGTRLLREIAARVRLRRSKATRRLTGRPAESECLERKSTA
jgi:hypothetical protein